MPLLNIGIFKFQKNDYKLVLDLSFIYPQCDHNTSLTAANLSERLWVKIKKMLFLHAIKNFYKPVAVTPVATLGSDIKVSIEPFKKQTTFQINLLVRR